MSDAWLSDGGVRVTDLERSLAFYHAILDLEELVRARDDDSAYVLLRDRRSGQRLELNWYAEHNPFWTAYTPGEGLDHLEIRVKSVPEMLARLAPRGIHSANRKLWTNAAATRKLREDPAGRGQVDAEVWTTGKGTGSCTSRTRTGSSWACTIIPTNRGTDRSRITTSGGRGARDRGDRGSGAASDHMSGRMPCGS